MSALCLLSPRPPFSIILKTIRKIMEDKATGLFVVPHWPTQFWCPYLASMLIAQAIILPRKHKLLYLPAEPERIHPLSKSLLPGIWQSLKSRDLSDSCKHHPTVLEGWDKETIYRILATVGRTPW